MKKLLTYTIDGIVQALCLRLLFCFLLSLPSQNNLSLVLIFGIFLVLFTAIVYIHILYRTRRNLQILLILLSNIFSFVVCSALILLIDITFPYTLFELRETNNADGILILISGFLFLSTCVFLKLVILIVMVIKRRSIRSIRGQSGDG